MRQGGWGRFPFALLFHLSFIIYHLAKLCFALKYLFSQSDGVALRHKHYSVESVGNDEDWQLCFAL